MMELKRLTAGQVAEIYGTYMTEAFPPSELRPLGELLERMERGIYRCLGLYDEGELRAYGYFVENRETGYLLLDFLAVDARHRGGGYGSRFLELLKDCCREDKGVLLECESECTAPDEEQRAVRQRRIRFYLKNGCSLTRTKTRLFGVDFDILYFPLGGERPDIAAEMEGIYRLMFGPDAAREHSRVWQRSGRIIRSERWRMADGAWVACPSLLSALGFPERDALPRIVSFVGAGGKTTTMYQMADELAEQGCRVLVTTTAHILKPAAGAVAVVDDIAGLTAGCWDGTGILTAGRQAQTDERKLAAPDGLGDEETMLRLLSLADVVLIEADGAKGHPLKVPAEYEPVLVPQTGLVVACAGLKAVNRPFRQACFRFDGHGRWLLRAGEDPVEPEDVALVLMDERGSHRNVDGRYYRIVLNQADGEEELHAARQILRALPFPMQEGCAVTAYSLECGRDK